MCMSRALEKQLKDNARYAQLQVAEREMTVYMKIKLRMSLISSSLRPTCVFVVVNVAVPGRNMREQGQIVEGWPHPHKREALARAWAGTFPTRHALGARRRPL